MLAEPRTGLREPGGRPRQAMPPEPAAPALLPVAGRAAYACRLPGGPLVLAGWYRDDASATLPESVPRVLVRSFVFAHTPGDAPDLDPAGDPEGAEATWGFLAATLDPLPALESAVIDLGTTLVSLDPQRLEIVSAAALGGLGLAGADAPTRIEAAAFMARLIPLGCLPAEARALGVELRAFRDAVRERPPVCSIDPGISQGLQIDSLHRIDDRSFYVRGWMRDAASEITSVTFISPEGARAEMVGALARFARPDVEQFYGSDPEQQATARPGIVGYFELDAPSSLPDGWVVEMGNHAGSIVEAAIPSVIDDLTATRAAVLGDLIHEVPGEETLVRDHAFPALSKLTERTGRAGKVASVVQYGVPPVQPTVTVVVALYQRIDFLEHQLAQWVDDPDLAGADLIYVLDSPELAAHLAASAGPLHRLYGVPFRTVVLSRNSGFAHANNAGAALARGRMLLLLNSDVVPDHPGWLSTMVDFYDRTPRVGALGPKLVYEDESIQHAGMYFLRPEGSALWENAHFFKGLHRSFPPANAPRIVPAVTGACLMVSVDLWRRIGGLKGTYVQGDYEDSDLCLRLADLGYDSWYLPAAELYHLEGQSYPTHLRRLTSRFNTWLHTHLWGDRIAEIMAAGDRPRRFRLTPLGSPKGAS